MPHTVRTLVRRQGGVAHTRRPPARRWRVDAGRRLRATALEVSAQLEHATHGAREAFGSASWGCSFVLVAERSSAKPSSTINVRGGVLTTTPVASTGERNELHRRARRKATDGSAVLDGSASSSAPGAAVTMRNGQRGVCTSLGASSPSDRGATPWPVSAELGSIDGWPTSIVSVAARCSAKSAWMTGASKTRALAEPAPHDARLNPVLRRQRHQPRPPLDTRRCAHHLAPLRRPRRSTPTLRPASAAPRSRDRACSRGCRAQRDPTPTRPPQPRRDLHLPARHRSRRDHPDRSRPPAADDPRPASGSRFRVGSDWHAEVTLVERSRALEAFESHDATTSFVDDFGTFGGSPLDVALVRVLG
jgi:hypothetical protein